MPVTHMPGEGKPAGLAERPAVAMPGSSLYHAGPAALAPSTIKVPAPVLYLALAATPAAALHLPWRITA